MSAKEVEWTLALQKSRKTDVKLDVFSRETEVHLELPHDKMKGTCQLDRENTVPSERQIGGSGH